MSEALKKPAADALPPGPFDLPPATVSKIASWLVGHTLDEVERELIVHTLENCNGDRVLAASVLGLSLPVLRRKITAFAVRGQPLPESHEPAPAAKDSAKAKEKKSEGAGPGGERGTRAPVPEAQNDAGLTAIVAEQPKPETVPAPVAAKTLRPKPGRRWLLAGAAVLLPVVPLAFYFTGAETRTDIATPERPRLEVSAIKEPEVFTPQIPVPVWNGPVPVIVDIAADKRKEAAAKAAALRTIRSVVNFDSEQDTIMEPASADISLDTIMERGPEAPRLPAFWAAIDIAQDTRMDSAPVEQRAAYGAEGAIGSIGAGAAFIAPEDVPEPLVRPEPEPRAKAAAPVRRRAAPAQAATPAPTGPQFFPFNLFNNDQSRAAPAAAAANTTAGVTLPAECCSRN